MCAYLHHHDPLQLVAEHEQLREAPRREGGGGGRAVQQSRAARRRDGNSHPVRVLYGAQVEVYLADPGAVEGLRDSKQHTNRDR